MAGRAEFWDWIAARYSRQKIGDEAAYRRKLDMTRRYFRPDMEILEVGCGTGSTALEHAPHVGHVEATDLSSAMLSIARHKAESRGVSNIAFRHAALDELDDSRPRFDMVLALNVIHLLADRDAGIARMARMLKPGGRLVSSTACIEGWQKLIVAVAPLGRFFGLLPMVRAFSPDQLVASMSAAGLTIEERWQPKPGAALFLVARKPENP